MTIEEFDNTAFGFGDAIRYHGKVYPIVSVDFEERIIGYEMPNDKYLSWARCENCEYIKFEKP